MAFQPPQLEHGTPGAAQRRVAREYGPDAGKDGRTAGFARFLNAGTGLAQHAVMEQKSIRVLIAENHRDLSEVMSQLIDTEPDMHCVGQVTDAAEVLPKARESSADAVIL